MEQTPVRPGGYPGHTGVLSSSALKQHNDRHIDGKQHRQRQQAVPRVLIHTSPPDLLSAHSLRAKQVEYTRKKTGRLGVNFGNLQFPGKDVDHVVKGITRQVILVKSPDPKLFEEAIFIVKEEAMNREGVSADQVIRQARQAADGYLKGNRVRSGRLGAFAGPLWCAAGALLASLAWGAWLFLL